MASYEFVLCEMLVIIITVSSCLVYGLGGNDSSGSAMNTVFCVISILVAGICAGVAGAENGMIVTNTTIIAIQMVRMTESIKNLLRD